MIVLTESSTPSSRKRIKKKDTGGDAGVHAVRDERKAHEAEPVQPPERERVPRRRAPAQRPPPILKVVARQRRADDQSVVRHELLPERRDGLGRKRRLDGREKSKAAARLRGVGRQGVERRREGAPGVHWYYVHDRLGVPRRRLAARDEV